MMGKHTGLLDLKIIAITWEKIIVQLNQSQHTGYFCKR